MTTCKI